MITCVCCTAVLVVENSHSSIRLTLRLYISFVLTVAVNLPINPALCQQPNQLYNLRLSQRLNQPAVQLVSHHIALLPALLLDQRHNRLNNQQVCQLVDHLLSLRLHHRHNRRVFPHINQRGNPTPHSLYPMPLLPYLPIRYNYTSLYVHSSA